MSDHVETPMLYCGDAKTLQHVEDGSVNLIITSPPYGLDKAYGEHGKDIDPSLWHKFMRICLRQMYRVAAPSGRLAINVPLDTTVPDFRPMYADTVRLAEEAGWDYRTSIVWMEGNVSKSIARGSIDSASAPHVIAPVEMIVLFHCPKDGAGWKRTDKKGKTLERQEWLDWTCGLWNFGNSRGWEGHPAPFPLELPRRLIKLLSFPEDLVLDPFMGSGTTAIAAAQLGRRFVGYDIAKEYVDSTKRRLEKHGFGYECLIRCDEEV